MALTIAMSHPEQFPDQRSIFLRLFHRRWWILGSIFVCTAATAVVAFVSKPVYRASVMLVPAIDDRSNMGNALNSALGAFGGLAGLAGLSAHDMQTEEALAVLRSRQFTEAFIKDWELMPKLFPKKWDAGRQQWKVPEDEQPTPAKTYKRFDDIRSIVHDKKTGLITLSIDWVDRQEAAAWANALVERLNLEMRSRAIQSANAAVGFLEKELASTSIVGTREAINRLIEAQIKQRMLANVTHEYAFRVVDRAMPPDRDDPVRPKKLMMLIAGFLLGLAGSVAVILVFDTPLEPSA